MRFAFGASIAVLTVLAVGACSSEPTASSPGSLTTPPGSTATPRADGSAPPAADGSTTPDPPVRVKPTTSSLNITGTEPATGNGTLSISSIEAENAGGNQTDRIRVTVIGSTGAKQHKITIYFFADNGQMSSITHQWADSLNDVFQADGVAYCDALGHDQPVCDGLYHDFTQRYITLKGTFLKGKFPGNDPTASTLDGAILYPAY